MNNVLGDYSKDKRVKRIFESLSKIGTLEDMQQALLLFAKGRAVSMSCEDIAYCPIDKEGHVNPILKRIYEAYEDALRAGAINIPVERYFVSMISNLQKALQVNSWNKLKQTLIFDKSFVGELINTDSSFIISDDDFEHFPYETFYMDFSENEEICKEIGVDGILVDISHKKEKSTREALKSKDENESPQIISTLYYRDGIFLNSATYLISPGDKECSIEEFIDRYTNIKEKPQTQQAVKGERPFGDIDKSRLFALQIKSLLYLTIKNPDIREKKSSIARHADAKRKRLPKSQMPEREYVVEERFGLAFRKWTQGVLDQGGDKSKTNGKGVRPHIRRAHFQRYLVGKGENKHHEKRWKHECPVGLEENEAEKIRDIVNHRVKKEKKKNKSDDAPKF